MSTTLEEQLKKIFRDKFKKAEEHEQRNENNPSKNEYQPRRVSKPPEQLGGDGR